VFACGLAVAFDDATVKLQLEEREREEKEEGRKGGGGGGGLVIRKSHRSS
jgi:hypothetical protein